VKGRGGSVEARMTKVGGPPKPRLEGQMLCLSRAISPNNRGVHSGAV
jgi:hypothetical protein